MFKKREIKEQWLVIGNLKEEAKKRAQIQETVSSDIQRKDDNSLKTGERVGDSLKTDKIKDYWMLFEQSSSGTGGSKKKISSNKINERMKNKLMQFMDQLSNTTNHMLSLLLAMYPSTTLNNIIHPINPYPTTSKIDKQIPL